ncbi:hypothetical protein MLD38_012329 [Melastoma candidum]|uniref:Uncharacterized protein n=1 Tax=Melastoma candidum TaxID=119954 RepID=A0ACB9R5K1_9MYRT|nr:hypothetical protein MLD38_012329 [Melastoma candidum]
MNAAGGGGASGCPVVVTVGGGCGGSASKKARRLPGDDYDYDDVGGDQSHLSIVELLVTALRKSMASCRVERGEDAADNPHEIRPRKKAGGGMNMMEIGWPTDVRHVTHVTFDRFNGFLGLPVEFEVEIPCRVPSASVSVFGVSAESMQCSYDARGNSVPSILLLMQEQLYSQGGLKAEGIFRINPENSQEELVRDQLNRGIVPEDIDVHCLAGLIKAWFRELPSGVLDGLSPEEVLQCNTEEDSIELVKQLNPTNAALLNWAVDLMADVVEEEEFNKMNARNIAMVFAPNMTQMSDPLTALMHAVQVMNLLKTLIMKTLREREDAATTGYSPMSSHSSYHRTDCDCDREMDTSCELRGPTSYCDDLDREDEDEDDDDGNYSHHSMDRDEDGSLSEIEECFLRRLDECERFVKIDGYPGRPTSAVSRERGNMSPGTCSGLFTNFESGVSFSDCRNGTTSLLTTSDSGEDTGTSRLPAERAVKTVSPHNHRRSPKDAETLKSIRSLPSLI